MNNHIDTKKIKHLRSLNFTEMYSPIQMYEAYKDIDGYSELLESNESVLQHIYGLNEEDIKKSVFSLRKKKEEKKAYTWSIVYNMNDLKTRTLLGLHRQLYSHMEMLGYNCTLKELRDELYKMNPHMPYLIIDEFPDTSYPPYAKLNYFTERSLISQRILPIVEILLNINDREHNILGETSAILNEPMPINELQYKEWAVNKNTMLINRKYGYNFEKFASYDNGLLAEQENNWHDQFTPAKREYDFFKSFRKLHFLELPPVKKEQEYDTQALYYRDMDQIKKDLRNANMMPIQLAEPLYREFLHRGMKQRSLKTIADALFEPETCDEPDTQLKMIGSVSGDAKYSIIFMVNTPVGIHQRICDLLRFYVISEEAPYFEDTDFYLFYGTPEQLRTDVGVKMLDNPPIVIESLGLIRPQATLKFTFPVELPQDNHFDLEELQRFAKNLEDRGRIGIVSRKGTFNINKPVYKTYSDIENEYWFIKEEMCFITAGESYSTDMKGLIEAALYEEQYLDEFLHCL